MQVAVYRTPPTPTPSRPLYTHTHTHACARAHTCTHMHTNIASAALSPGRKLTPQTPAMPMLRCAAWECSNMKGCNLACLEADTFNFTGSRDVTTLDIGGNLFTELPEELLWSTPALVDFNAGGLEKLETLPDLFFQGPEGQHTLKKIHFTGCTNVGSQQRLPEQLFHGLGSVETLDVSNCGMRNMPSLDSLTVRDRWSARTPLSPFPSPRGYAYCEPPRFRFAAAAAVVVVEVVEVVVCVCVCVCVRKRERERERARARNCVCNSGRLGSLVEGGLRSASNATGLDVVERHE